MIVAKVMLDTAKLQALIADAPQKAGQIVRAIALDAERDVKQSMGASPSAAGDPPGVDTGALRASIHVERRTAFTQAVVTGTDYAHFLEFGTTRMAARPYMGPMAMRLQLGIDDYWQGFAK